MKRCPKPPTKTMKKTLDYTLRYLYAAIRYARCDIMAIEFKYNGIVWRADTIKEAVELRAELYRSTHFPIDPTEKMDEADRFWTPDRFVDAIEGIGDLQRDFLTAICRKPGISSKDLVTELRMDSEVALAGVISGLSKQLKKMQIEPRQVFLIRVDWKGKSKNRTFLLDDFFVGAGMEQNWPDAWEQEKLAEIFGSKSLVGDDPDIED